MAGSDGGLSQYFMLEVVGGDLLYASESAAAGKGQFGETVGQGDNEISTLNDQVSPQFSSNVFSTRAVGVQGVWRTDSITVKARASERAGCLRQSHNLNRLKSIWSISVLVLSDFSA